MTDNDHVRLHGNKPYTVAVVHGGPGGVGEARPLAEELSKEYGVIEPFLLSESFEAQVSDLKAAIKKYASGPVTLVGHSYGAMLSYVFAARFPVLVQKLILVSSGVLEAKNADNIDSVRLSRLSTKQKAQLEVARKTYKESEGSAKERAFVTLFTLIKQIDAYSLVPHESDLALVRPKLYNSVWKGMQALRDSGELVRLGEHIKCPVIAIHGDYDPRSGKAIQASLEKYVKDLHFTLLEKCGHYPWYEKYARDEFYKVLRTHGTR